MSDVLSLEATLRRLDAIRSEEVAAARGGEYAAAQGSRRTDALQRDAAGGGRRQTMTPARGGEMIDFVHGASRMSIRRAVPACRATYHYRSRGPERAPLRRRIREIAVSSASEAEAGLGKCLGTADTSIRGGCNDSVGTAGNGRAPVRGRHDLPLMGAFRQERMRRGNVQFLAYDGQPADA